MPFIHLVDRDRKLSRMSVSEEIVRLAEERQQLWSQLRELAGLIPSESVRERLVADVEAQYEVKLAAMRAEYELKIANVSKDVARKMAEALLRNAGAAVMEKTVSSRPSERSERVEGPPVSLPVETGGPSTPALRASARDDSPVAVVVAAAVAVSDDAPLSIDPSIDSARCTTCNECINLNGKLFSYNADKQAEVRDAAAGTFQQLVTAAERCPVSAIHPGTPRNPKEKDLAKWLKRAEPFN
jgi:pyruvate-ferredoxin/flavodoxin oxidoreductase